MKKIIYSIFGLMIFSLASCIQDQIILDQTETKEGEDIMVHFTTVIPAFNTIQTRGSDVLNDIYLLVFDENGNFIVRKKAVLTKQTTTGGTFTAQLPSTDTKRIIHFISNYNWDNFIDSPGINEAGVVTKMNSQKSVYWSRVVLEHGITATIFNNTQVVMLRNEAKISVIDEANDFTYAGFTIHNKPQTGTVAPYSVATGFVEGIASEPHNVALLPAQKSGISTNEQYLFERKNASATNITTVIVQGSYNGQTYFYKIDLIDVNKQRLDILRNWHYVVKIKTVTKEGYSSFDDALAGASHNNAVLDPIIEKYPIISDGISKLELEKTMVILTHPGQTFQVWTKYFPDTNSSTIDNSGITVSLDAGSEAIDPSSLSFNPTTGIISAKAIDILPSEPLNARIVITKGEIARTIRVIFRPTFSFDPVTINNTNPATLNGAQGENAILRFTIPNDFPADLLPLPIKIYNQGLYPSSSGLQMIVEKGIIYYIYMATSTGQHEVNFKTNKSQNVELVTLKADYFEDGIVSYNYLEKTGNLTYGSNRTSIPYALRNNLSSSTGYITVPLNEDGKYNWIFSTFEKENTHTVNFEVVEGNQNYIYSGNFTPNNVTSIHLNTKILAPIKDNSITYGGANFSVAAGTIVPYGTTVTASTGSIVVTENGKFRYSFPESYTNTTSVTFTITKEVNSSYKEEYTIVTTIGELMENGEIKLTPNKYIFTGSIKYGNNNDVPSDAPVSLQNLSGSNINMTGKGTYKLTIPASASEENKIKIIYIRNSNTYYSERTVASFKTNTSLNLKTNGGT